MKGRIFSVICMAMSASLFAQKLPNIQQMSLRAPANVKIDGKAVEWGKLQAYNRATDIFYTIANDDTKLYLTIQVTNWNTMTNIMNGGVKFVIQKTGTKDDADAPFIKYPYLEKGKPIMINPNGLAQGDADSVAMQDNKLLASKIKWIYVKGLGGMDTLLSIYNDRGVAAANALDVKRTYTLETSIELSLFRLSAEDLSKISYHILINAEPNKFTYSGLTDPLRSNLIRNMSNFNSSMEQVDKAVASFESAGNRFAATTDFSGEYTLAK